MSNNALIQSMANHSIKGGAVITPSDTGTHNYNSFMVNSSGNVTISFVGGGKVLMKCLGGTVYRCKITRVWTTDLTASGITGLNPRE